ILWAGAAAALVLALLGWGVRAWRLRREVERFFAQALSQMATGNWSGCRAADRAYEEILASAPHNAQALAGRALCRSALAFEFDESAAEAKRALDLARQARNPPPSVIE